VADMQDLTPTVQDYLKVIWGAGEWTDEPVTTKAVSGRLDVSPSTVSEAVKKLTRQGWLDHAPYGSINLTESGLAEAVKMVRRHRIIETFLHEVLGYAWDEVHAEAELLEHAVSDRFIDGIDVLLGHPERDPHGDPIPFPDGRLPEVPAIRLSEAPADTPFAIARVSDSEPGILRYLSEVGLGLDSRLEIVRRTDVAGTITVDVGGRQVELGLPAARAIWVIAL
jgi:DtxR family Mn-dependent transcriptional regulator